MMVNENTLKDIEYGEGIPLELEELRVMFEILKDMVPQFDFSSPDKHYGHHQFPVETQLKILGLDSKKLEKLRKSNAKVLDFGCGNGSLVYHLRDNGINAEGLDPHAPNESFFIRQEISTKEPYNEILKLDSEYDLITGFQNPTLTSALRYTLKEIVEEGDGCRCNRCVKEAKEFYKKHNDMAKNIVKEMGRVLKPNGQAIIFPFWSDISYSVKKTMKESGFEYAQERVKAKEVLFDYFKGFDQTYEEEGFLSVLTKNNSIPDTKPQEESYLF